MRKPDITRDFAREFDEKCARADSHGFLRFLTEPDENDVSILDLVKQVGDVTKYRPATHDRDMDLSEDTIKEYMNEFFGKYFPNKAEEVKQILDKTHPYFIDQDGENHINFIYTQKGDPRSSGVGHSNRNTFLNFDVFVHNSIDDLRTTAHELAHALSSHHKRLIELIRSDAPPRQIEDYTRKGFARDCVGEIESHIVEKLFNKFLLEKGIYSEKDIENYNKEQEDSLLNEINLIREERTIIKNLPCPVRYEDLKFLVDDLERCGKEVLVDRIGKMHDDPKCSSYMFRYFVGRVVSDQWIKKFDGLQSEEERAQMLENFENYLDKTSELDLDGACKDLFDLEFSSIVEDYATDKVNENKQNDLDDEAEL